ncbi:MFS transporter [Nocardioides jiangxiensis]|uniref:MFS transporter n=1 Tax=Nocardioides jiangxiensis TaxID=3064524 RepID=A0ABT9B492_9ACTN|nr:MFS transporter [Nocardioides sp. WY-20]MDO7869634.1 MFS transporter [Nocardioides sp. WY-20]
MTSRVDKEDGVTDGGPGTSTHVDESTWQGRALVPALVYIGLLIAMISSLGAPLVPTIAGDYGVSLGTAQWTLTVALLVGAVSVPMVGRLADGPRRLHILVAVLAAMTVGSMLAGLPTDVFALLLLGRALQGVGLSLLPLVMGIARDHLSPARARSTMATLSVTTVVGVGLGYPITGAIADNVSYRYAFWFAAVLGLVAIALALLVVPTSQHHPSERFDLVGSVLLAVGLGAMLLAISMGEEWGWGSGRILGMAAAAIAALALWTWHQLRATAPLVDLRLMRDATVTTSNLAGLFAGVGMYMLMSMVIRFVQTPTSTGYGLGESVLVGSLVLIPLSAMSYFSSRLSAALGRRMGPAYILCLGMLAFTAALLFFITERGHLWQILVVMGLGGLGVGCSFAVMPRMIVGAVPASQTSSALAMNQVLRQIGYSVGSALSATVLTAHTTGASPFPTDRGFTVGAWVAVGLCVLTAAVVVGVQLVERSTTPEVDQLLIEENADAAIAGVVGFEPAEVPAAPRRAGADR